MVSKWFKRCSGGMRRTRILALAACLLMTFIVPFIQGGVRALAEDTITAIHMDSNGDSGINNTVTVEAGKTYTFTVLWKSVTGAAPDFALSGNALGAGVTKSLVLADTPQEGVKYDTTGRLIYTFVSQGTEFGMYGRMGKGVIDTYFSQPTLYESDNAGNPVENGSVIDCSPDFSAWSDWGYRSECFNKVQVAADFFHREPTQAITAIHMTSDGETGIQNTVTVQTGKTYTLSVLWKSVTGANPDFTVGGSAIGSYISLMVGNEAKEGATYDDNGRMSYTFVSQGTSLELYGRMGKGTIDTYFAMPMLYESDANGNTIAGGGVIDCNPDFSAWSTWNYRQECINQEQVAADFFKKKTNPQITALHMQWQGDTGIYQTVSVEQGKTYTFSVLWKYETGTAPEFRLEGDAIGSSAKKLIVADAVQEGVSYDSKGRLTYTFVSQGTSLTMVGQMSAGYVQAYFAQPTLVESDAQGTPVEGGAVVDCDPEFNTTWQKWNYGQDCLVIEQVASDFFKRASADTVTTMHMVCKEAAGLSNEVTVENGKTYTFSVLYKYVRGIDPSFTLRGNALANQKQLVLCAGVEDGVNYDRLTGKLSYTFTSVGTKFEMYAFMGYSAVDEASTAEFYYAQPTLVETDAQGNPVEGGAVVDCDAEFETSWPQWNYGGDYRKVEQKAPEFFMGADSIALSALNVGYSLTPTFYQDTLEYAITVPYTVNELNIQYTLADGATLKEITGNTGFADGMTKDVLIAVNNTEGGTTTYTIHVTREVNPATAIKAMRLREWGNDAGVEYSVPVEEGKTYTFSVLWKYVKGDQPFFQIGGEALSGVYAKLIIRDQPQAGVDYDPVTGKVSYTFVAKGKKLTIAGLLGAGSSEKDVYFAQQTLFESDEQGNPIAGVPAIDCDADFNVEGAWSKWYGGEYRYLTDVRPDFFVRTDFPNALTSLDIGYPYAPAFDYRRTIYDVTVPYTMKKLDIKYTLADNCTLNKIEGNEGFEDGVVKNVVVSVNDDQGGVTNYTIRVKRQNEPAAALASLDVGYPITPAFSASVFNYTLSVPNSVKSLTVNHTETDNSTFKSVTGNTDLAVGIPTDVVITLTNTKGAETKYTITVTRQGAGGDTTAMAAALKEAASKLNCTNATTADSLKKDLKAAIGDSYNVAVAEFYKLSAVPGAKDNNGVIMAGSNGYISAVINLTNGSQLAELPLMVSIKAPVVTYNFAADEISKASDFELEDDGKYLTAYTGSAKKIVIPDGVEEIGFGWNQSDDLGSGVVLVIPDSVKILPESLTYGMKHLETVYLGDGITELPSSTFDRSIFLANVRLPENLKEIGANAFAGTTSLVHLRLPDRLEKIGANAFYFSLIRDITVPASVKTIGDGAFASPYSAAFQLVKGSSNMYFMFVFETDSDPDLARLKQISNANVDYTDSKGNVYDTLEDAPIGYQWGGDKPWPNGPVYVTDRVVTLLNKDAQIGKDVFYTQNGFYNGGVTVRLYGSSAAKKIVDAEIAVMEAKAEEKAQETGEKKAIIGVVTQVLDMTITESVARAQFATDHLLLTDESTADSVLAAVKAAYVSTVVKNSPVWKEAFKLADGTATGVMTLQNDKVKFDVVLHAVLTDLVNPTDPENPGETSKPSNPGISEDLIPLSIVKGSKVVRMDWDGEIMTVLNNTTISKFLQNVKLMDGYTLEFFDDEGYEIYEEYYDTAILEDGFAVRLKKGYSRINEFSFVTTNSLPNPDTGNDTTIIPILMMLMLVAGAVIVRQWKRKTVQ